MSVPPPKYGFKHLALKEVVRVVNAISTQGPPVTLEALEKPAPEQVLGMFESIAEFAYELPLQQIKASVPPSVQPREIFQDSLDLLVVHTLSRQLALINGIDDFGLKDIWEPNRKRLHTLLSGFINFCRYKESNNNVVSQMKDDVQSMAESLREAQDQLRVMEHRLADATNTHEAEQPEVRLLEGQVREARAALEKQQKALQDSERVLEDKEAALEVQKRKTADMQQKGKDVAQLVADLQGEVAESPEGLEQEIQELNAGIQQLKARLEEKANEKRSRGQRVQALSRLEGHIARYTEDLDRVTDAASKAASSKAGVASAKDELAELERSLEGAEASRVELEQATRQVTTDLDKAKAEHEEVLQGFESRREKALEQQRDVQAKRTDESRRHEALMLQKDDLETEILEAKRAHEVEMAELDIQFRVLQENAYAYKEDLEAAMQARGAPPAAHTPGRLSYCKERSRSPLIRAHYGGC
mmetsp:Transcript_66220/g.123635  ORF Transcript_66220/g.123635 Transcript_66220/m.123635 type:complete len:474 (+) Transcript_66220:64-1485(+)